MLDQVGTTMIGKAGRKAVHQPDRPVRRPSSKAPASGLTRRRRTMPSPLCAAGLFG